MENLESLAYYLQHMFFWMANCVELRAYVSASMTPLGHRLSIAEVLDESVIVLSDAVTYAFQQTVYHLTKVSPCPSAFVFVLFSSTSSLLLTFLVHLPVLRCHGDLNNFGNS